jgi:signal transduction histidine kinase
MRQRLYHRILATMLVFVLLALVGAALAGHLLLAELIGDRFTRHVIERMQGLLSGLPAGEKPSADLQAALEGLAAEHRVQAALWSSSGERLAFTSAMLPAPAPGTTGPVWLAGRQGPVLVTRLADGRVLVVQPHRVPRPLGFLLAVAGLAALLAVASYPVARRITRRLETLEAGVRRLGEGELDVRIVVDGDDELASLAISFNRAAERLQALVEAQRRVLASASHELRSPLARLRMALELQREDGADVSKRVDEAVVEVEELDSLVEELLVAGRLEVQAPSRPEEPIDVGELLAAEAARLGARAVVQAAPLRLDARLLKVLLRNLLENAQRHGGGSAVEAGVESLPGRSAGVRVWVADRGPGVPDSERERIFEPFYRSAGHVEGRDGGVGLGLYLVRRIARSCGGDAVCRPREGGGTVFEITLAGPPFT